ncbi:helix-turn-helix domain-containing protein [Novosphingobium sp. KCTC 2891]|uniref:helix-turn-helix domain-containing protein n=1 Tax=Novosphingobium sp. KCTC 2891 TaxID=2989730 RepID=UPI00222343DE|nr:helix-turn-helix domain-containing protein [Novosphingobium sp. KCTC 2891]MCW1384881.1 helix-turn-helix domain-containing protein [Novosphingobium sp. KCTC 2891]
MARETFHVEGSFSDEEKAEADSFVTRLIYGGSSEVSAVGPSFAVHLEQVASRPFPCFSSQVRTNYVWRRSSADVRKDGSDFCVIRLIRSGTTRITQMGRTLEFHAGDIIVTRSNMPIFSEILPDGDGGVADTALLLVPSATLQKYLEVDAIVNCPLPRDTPHYRVLVDMIEMLAHRSFDFDEETGDLLATALCVEMRKLSQVMVEGADSHISVPEARLVDIRAQIRAHFSNPYLSLEMIARKCNISTRYVSYIMSKYGTSFYEELKMERLNTARNILKSDKNKNMPIKQVAFFTGFKSTSHFSTAYKKTFGISPHEERAH